MAQEQLIEVYKKYTEKLVKCLPMDDTLFVTKLSHHNLLPGDTHNHLKKAATQPDKASYFLDHVIKPALDIDDTSSFDNLLSVMDQCGYTHVKTLASKIKSEIKMNDSEPGSYKHMMCINLYCYKKLKI